MCMDKDTIGIGKMDWHKITFKKGKKKIKEFVGQSSVSMQKSRQEDYRGGKERYCRRCTDHNIQNCSTVGYEEPLSSLLRCIKRRRPIYSGFIVFLSMQGYVHMTINIS